MALNRREQIMIGGGALLLAIAWIATSPPPTPPPSSENARKGITIASGSEIAQVIGDLKRAPELSKADPFKPIGAATSVSEEGDKTPHPDRPFTLQGVFRDDKGAAAIINGEIVYEGKEILPGVLLLRVEDKKVIIKRLDGETEIGF